MFKCCQGQISFQLVNSIKYMVFRWYKVLYCTKSQLLDGKTYSDLYISVTSLCILENTDHAVLTRQRPAGSLTAMLQPPD